MVKYKSITSKLQSLRGHFNRFMFVCFILAVEKGILSTVYVWGYKELLLTRQDWRDQIEHQFEVEMEQGLPDSFFT